MRIFKNITFVLSTGYILVYFSEHLFWARVRPGDSLPGWLATWAAYSLVAFVFLTLISTFQLDNLWSLFLAGAAVGWLTEGVIVQTTYEALPLSISFTGLAWHALISVWVGWYALRKSLHDSGRFSVLKPATGIGIGYGLWAINWWIEPDGGVATIQEFGLFSLTTGLLFAIACFLADWAGRETFNPDRRVTLFIASLFGLYFFTVTVPAAPISLVILPVLLGLVLAGLKRSARSKRGPALHESPTFRVPLLKYLSLLALPLAACLVYALAFAWKIQFQTNWVLYMISTPLGFMLFGLSLYRAWRNQPQA